VVVAAADVVQLCSGCLVVEAVAEAEVQLDSVGLVVKVAAEVEV